MGIKGHILVEGSTKECRTCGETKEIESFRLRADKKARRPHCNKCLNARANYSDAGKRARFKWVMRNKYGITPEEFSEILFMQGGVCKICKGAPKILGRLFVDHCHATGKVRGLLCNTCNAGLGQFGDNKEILAAALDYLRAADGE